MRPRRWIVSLGVAVCASACTLAPPASNVFTTAHSTNMAAVREFFGLRASAQQPIPFPHQTHVEKAMLKCTETCHESVEKGPAAGIPSVKTWLICDGSIAADRPLLVERTIDD